MSKHTKHRTTVVLPAMLLIIVLLGACGDPTKKSTSPATAPAASNANVVGLSTCANCHTGVTAAWMKTKHANAGPTGDVTSVGSPRSTDLVNAECRRCHDPFGDGTMLTPGYTGNTARPVVGCEACHGGGSLHADAGGIGTIGIANKAAAGGYSAQFNTCTYCHELVNAAGTGSATAIHDAGGGDPRVVSEASTTNANSITDTHFATALTAFGSSGQNWTGYAMDFSSEKVCSDCHNPHGAADINREWAQSAHGNSYRTTTAYFVGAWVRSNWSCNGTSTQAACGTTTITDRRWCQRCHTTSGFIAFADALRDGNVTQAHQILQGDLYNSTVVAYSPNGWKPELLKCNGCHTDNKGSLRNPGPITTRYDYYTRSVATTGAATVSVYTPALPYTYPDAGNSNICVSCHSGRENGETIKALNTDASLSTFNFGSGGLITSHFLTGGGTVYTAQGFEFAGRSYDNYANYRHGDIGTSKEPGTGSNGPCIGCHMSRPNKSGNHVFLPITRAYTSPSASAVSRANATITAIASEVCLKCHGPNDTIILDLVKGQRTLYKEATEAFAHVSGLRDRYFNENYYNQKDGTEYRLGLVTVTTGSTVVTGGTATSLLVAGIAAGADQFRVDGTDKWYTIASVDSATQLTLATAYTGAGASNVRYSILKNESAVFTKGSITVTGINTNWQTTGVRAGSSTADFIRNDADGTWYRIRARTNTSITLGTTSTTGAVTFTPYSGETGTNSYTIIVGSSNSNWLSPFDTDTTGNTTGKNNMGAALNLYLFEADPAGYVHNRIYMKRLMYDSIDWIDDNSMNYSTGATLNAICTATVPAPPAWCAGAMEYALPNGVLPGAPAERP